VFGEYCGINCGGSDNKLEIRPPWQEIFEITKKKIDIEASFMGLVNDDDAIFFLGADPSWSRQEGHHRS